MPSKKNALRRELIEALERVPPEQMGEILKAAVLVAAVSAEKSEQILPLRKQGLSFDQMAAMWGVDLQEVTV